MESASKTKELAKLKDAAQAQYVAAFSAARRRDMVLARERFADLKEQAANLPDKERDEQQPRTASPTLEEEAAYQHAVCTAALGEKEAAEAKYLQFMRDYPESPLINGALKRIELLHDGHLPPEAEKVWMQATGTAQARQRERRKAADLEMSRCGPECLAEFLRRHNRDADAAALAEEMKTSERRLSLQPSF